MGNRHEVRKVMDGAYRPKNAPAEVADFFPNVRADVYIPDSKLPFYNNLLEAHAQGLPLAEVTAQKPPSRVARVVDTARHVLSFGKIATTPLEGSQLGEIHRDRVSTEPIPQTVTVFEPQPPTAPFPQQGK